MSNSISSDIETASVFATDIQASLEDYPVYGFCKLHPNNMVSGSTIYDGLESDIESALNAWADLIVADGQTIESAAAEIAAFDESLAQGFLGFGG